MENQEYPIFDLLFPLDNQERENAFRFIIGEIMKSGFGVMSKSEIDLIFFTAVLRYSKIKDKSDYSLAMLLKITPQRIRNFKEKYSVKFQEVNEKEMINNFFKMCKHARTDERYIDIPVYDVAIKNLLENKLEERNIVLHSQLNSKIFRLRADDLVSITVALVSSYKIINSDETEKKLIGYIKDNESKYKDVIKNINKIKSFKDFLERIKSMPISSVVEITSGFATISAVVVQCI